MTEFLSCIKIIEGKDGNQDYHGNNGSRSNNYDNDIRNNHGDTDNSVARR